ncbi:hypothetical protein GGI26_002767 [Coemansia sp. RSA 1358]|nr:hypothetical protein GGI26_002767 [Coemansia sp. RSA 1358]
MSKTKFPHPSAPTIQMTKTVKKPTRQQGPPRKHGEDSDSMPDNTISEPTKDEDDDEDDDFAHGGVDGPRRIYCVCRRGAAPDEPMLECSDCAEMFHGPCVGVSVHILRQSQQSRLFVCDSCLELHHLKPRIPGTILGVWGRVARSPNAAADPLPQNAMAASALDDMDDDDICPICEDDCTCGNSRDPLSNSANAPLGHDGGAPMPLFSQLAKHPASSAAITVHDSKPAPDAKKQPKRSKRTKSTGSTLISRLVSAMESKRPASDAPTANFNDIADEEVLATDGLPIFSGEDAIGLSNSDSDFGDTAFAATPEKTPATVAGAKGKASAESPPKNTALPYNDDTDAHFLQSNANSGSVPLEKTKKLKANPKAKKPAKRGRPAKSAAAAPAASTSASANTWQKKKKQLPSRLKASEAEPTIYEVSAAVIRGRSPKTSSANNIDDNTDDDDDEFINITDVTSDASTAGVPSETEFDLPASRSSIASSRHEKNEWSDSNILDADDEDIEQEETAYLTGIRDQGYSSSSLSDLDDDRLARIRSKDTLGSVVDSGDESDSESSQNESAARKSRQSTRRKHQKRLRKAAAGSGSEVLTAAGFFDSNGLSDVDSLGTLLSENSESETDQELTFRAARTEEEQALVEYREPEDEREDALLEMHLEQLRAVRNVIQDCSSPLLEHTASDVDMLSDEEREIMFTYHSDSSDSASSLSDDLMDGWGTDTRRRWEEVADDGSSSDSSLSDSKVDKLMLKDTDEQSDIYSSDSYEEFYARRAFLDIGSDLVDGMLVEDMYPSGMDLDSASLALGVAMSMEQQGYSKEDAAAAAAAAAAAYPSQGQRRADSGMLSKQIPTTTITASMNAHGEADPIDGIVSIKSSTATNTASRRATGAHTPFDTPGWNAAVVAAAAAAYLDSSSQPPAVPYVLPRDLNEARSPNVALAAAAAAEAEAASAIGVSEFENSNAVMAEAVDVLSNSATGADAMGDSTVPHELNGCSGAAASATSTATLPLEPENDAGYIVGQEVIKPEECDTPTKSAPPVPSAFTSQLPNSSFYKPLSSICSPMHRSSSSSAVAVHAGAHKQLKYGADSAYLVSPTHALQSEGSAPQTAVDASTSDASFSKLYPADIAHGMPLVSLSEADNALAAFAEHSTPNTPDLQRGNAWSEDAIPSAESTVQKRKASEGMGVVSQESVIGEKRRRSDITGSTFADCSSLGLPALFAESHRAQTVAGIGIDMLANSMMPSAMPPTLTMGAGTPMQSTDRARLADAMGSDDDDWLLTMDQLVDTEALMIESPPPSPAESCDPGIVSDISEHLVLPTGAAPPAPDGRNMRRQISKSTSGTDLFARWDRIPVNIFRRSRALASNHRREIGAQDDAMGTMSPLALTAIKSSRQRRALINTTLLTQHTLPSEAAIQHSAIKRALKSSSNNGNSNGSKQYLVGHKSGPIPMMISPLPPPPPPPTPLSFPRANTQAGKEADISQLSGEEAAHTSASHAKSLDFTSSQTKSAQSSAVAELANSTSWEVSSQMSDYSSEALDGAAESSRAHLRIASGRSAGESGGRVRAEGTQMDADDERSECGYTFDWLEDEADLSLFAKPDLAADDMHPSMTMVLASASPMLVPFNSANNNGDATPKAHQPL